MSVPRHRRPALLPQTLRNQIKRYVMFRHVFRHLYTYQLNWEEMRPLVDDLPATWADFRTAIETFLEKS
jgi:hypothetical protein